ncbi:MAG: endonuclease, partial [Acidimicrobiia bacterium]
MLRVRGTNRPAGLLLALALLTSLFTAVVAAPASAGAGPSVFVNEIHYDNDSTDAGEAVEIAGPAGTDLTGWSVALYTGSNGTVYATITLSGTLPDQDNGFGTLAFPHAGIQNGAPDGLALVDDTAAVVQFLSYEGAFAATDGPALGMTSTDIGVSEASSSPVGDSLQLTGSGFTYDDFTWADSAPNTFDAVNTGQTFDATPVILADPVINEFVANTTGTDTNEYLEVSGDPDGNYAAFTILEIEGDSSGPGVVDGVFPV